MYSKSETPTEWYAVFTAAKINNWFYNHVIHKDFGHCYAIQDLNDYQWLVVQPRINLVDIRILLKSQYPHVKMIAGPDAKVLQIAVKPQSRSIGCLNFSTCTEVVKGLLGIKSFWTFTPRQLYKGLLGGKYGRISS